MGLPDNENLTMKIVMCSRVNFSQGVPGRLFQRGNSNFGANSFNLQPERRRCWERDHVRVKKLNELLVKEFL